MKIFITGGCKNGKSTYAELLVNELKNPLKPLYYLATMVPSDEEDHERILRHRRQRENFSFETIEIPYDIDNCLKICDKDGVFLLDSITALLSNEMFKLNGTINKNAHIKIIKDINNLLSEINSIVLVSDYIFSDFYPYDDLTNDYRKGLGEIHKHIARFCDVVIEVAFGNLTIHKGQEEFKNLYEKIV